MRFMIGLPLNYINEQYSIFEDNRDIWPTDKRPENIPDVCLSLEYLKRMV